MRQSCCCSHSSCSLLNTECFYKQWAAGTNTHPVQRHRSDQDSVVFLTLYSTRPWLKKTAEEEHNAGWTAYGCQWDHVTWIFNKSFQNLFSWRESGRNVSHLYTGLSNPSFIPLIIKLIQTLWLFLFFTSFLFSSPSAPLPALTWQERITGQTTTQTDAGWPVTHPSLSWSWPSILLYFSLFRRKKRNTVCVCVWLDLHSSTCELTVLKLRRHLTQSQKKRLCSLSDSTHRDEVKVQLVSMM